MCDNVDKGEGGGDSESTAITGVACKGDDGGSMVRALGLSARTSLGGGGEGAGTDTRTCRRRGAEVLTNEARERVPRSLMTSRIKVKRTLLHRARGYEGGARAMAWQTKCEWAWGVNSTQDISLPKSAFWAKTTRERRWSRLRNQQARKRFSMSKTLWTSTVAEDDVWATLGRAWPLA